MTETDEQQPKLIHVQTIGEKGKSRLIQTEDCKRYFVPASKVRDETIDQETLDKAALHGVAWESYLDLSDITAESVALMLRQNGIYTVDDLRQKDRRLIRIGTNLIGRAVQSAAKRAAEAKPPRRK